MDSGPGSGRTPQVEEGLGRAVPGGFDLRVYPGEAAARVAINQGTVYGL